MTAFFFLIVAPVVLLIALWIMKAYDRRKNQLHFDRRRKTKSDDEMT